MPRVPPRAATDARAPRAVARALPARPPGPRAPCTAVGYCVLLHENSHVIAPKWTFNGRNRLDPRSSDIPISFPRGFCFHARQIFEIIIFQTCSHKFPLQAKSSENSDLISVRFLAGLCGANGGWDGDDGSGLGTRMVLGGVAGQTQR